MPVPPPVAPQLAAVMQSLSSQSMKPSLSLSMLSAQSDSVATAPAHMHPGPQVWPSHSGSAQSTLASPLSSMPLLQISTMPSQNGLVKHWGSAQSTLPSPLSSLLLLQISLPLLGGSPGVLGQEKRSRPSGHTIHHRAPRGDDWIGGCDGMGDVVSAPIQTLFNLPR